MPCFFNGCKKKSYCANHSSDNHIRHPVDRYQCSVFVPYFDLNDVGTFSLMNKSNIVGNLFQIRGDMGGHQDGMVFILHEIQKDIKNIIPHNRVKTAGRLV